MERDENMKMKILAAAVACSMLAACGGSDNDNSVTPEDASHSVMAYDPAVRGMNASYSCDNGTSGSAGTTDNDGIVKITNTTVVNTPDTCSFTFTGATGAVDMSNGKDMSKVSYKIPRGLAKAGSIVTASPLTTLIANKLGDAEYTESAAIEVLSELGLDVTNSTGISVEQLLLNTENVLETQLSNASLVAQVRATTAVLSDVLVVSPNAPADNVAQAAKKIANEVIKTYPNYPKSGSGDDEIYLDFTADTTVINDVVSNPGKDIVITLPEAKPSKPVDTTEPPATGGTGGTGGEDNGGGTGD